MIIGVASRRQPRARLYPVTTPLPRGTAQIFFERPVHCDRDVRPLFEKQICHDPRQIRIIMGQDRPISSRCPRRPFL
jgi:hypothetical protein